MLFQDELFLSTPEDQDLSKIELIVIDDLRSQLLNEFGDFKGTYNDNDIILEYVRTIFSNVNYDTIDDFENVCKTCDRTDEYDTLVRGILRVYNDILGIKFDLDRENVYFSDLYDVYLIFVLSLRSSINDSTRGYYQRQGLSEDKFPRNPISEYILSDEFCAHDDFLKNMCNATSDMATMNLSDKNYDNILVIDHEKFVKFVYDFMKYNGIEVNNG